MQNKPEILQAAVWMSRHCSIPTLSAEDQLAFGWLCSCSAVRNGVFRARQGVPSREQHVSLPLLPKQPAGPAPSPLAIQCHLHGGSCSATQPCAPASPLQHSPGHRTANTILAVTVTDGCYGQGTRHSITSGSVLWGHPGPPVLTAAAGTAQPYQPRVSQAEQAKPSPAFIKTQC